MTNVTHVNIQTSRTQILVNSFNTLYNHAISITGNCVCLIVGAFIAMNAPVYLYRAQSRPVTDCCVHQSTDL